MLTKHRRRASLLVAVLATTVATVLASVPAQAVTIDPDVPSLPEGAPPKVPYLDVPGRAIVDGSTRVDVRGLQGTVSHLFKVDGGYVLGRRSFGKKPDLVFVSASGRRTLITTRWYAYRCDCVPTYALVDSTGGSVTFNRLATKSNDYTDTLTVALPSLKIVRKRAFSAAPELFDQRGGSVYVGLTKRLLRWTPKTNATTTLSSGRWVEAADISAQQQVPSTSSGDYHQTVEPIPPRTGTPWMLAGEDHVSAWSPDNQLIAITGELIGEDTQAGIYARQSATGSTTLLVRTWADSRVVWEDSSTLLLQTYYEGTEQQMWDIRYQLVRCTLAGECERIGPETSRGDNGYVLATRRGN